MKSCLVSFLILFLSQISIFAQYDSLEFYCNYTQEDTLIVDAPATPYTDTTNLAILLCIEKGQPKEIPFDFTENHLYNLKLYD